MASTLDILPTIASLAGAKLPQVMLDGVDMTNILISQGKVLIHLIKYLNTFVKLMMVFFPRVKGSSWCSIPPTPVRYTASSPSGWKNTRPTSIHKVGNVQANAFLSKPKQHFWLFFFYFLCIRCLPQQHNSRPRLLNICKPKSPRPPSSVWPGCRSVRALPPLTGWQTWPARGAGKDQESQGAVWRLHGVWRKPDIQRNRPEPGAMLQPSVWA